VAGPASDATTRPGRGRWPAGQVHAGPHHRAVDGDVLQIASEEQFQLARRLGGIPPLDGPRDQARELVVELIGDGPWRPT